MLWWIIGVWLAIGAALPAFWLLSMAYRRLASLTIGPRGLCVLSGLSGIGVGALILALVCSFSDSIITTRDMPSAPAVPQTPMTHLAEARLIQLLVTPPLAQFSANPMQTDTDIEEGEVRRGLLREPPSLGEAEQVAPVQSGIGDAGEGAGNGVSRQTDGVVPQVSVLAALLTAALHPELGGKRGTPSRHARGPSVRPYYVIRSASRGIWLFAPNGNEGAGN